MHRPGSQYQQSIDTLFVADVTLTGSAQLVLPQSPSRGFLILQNLGAHSMAVEIGGPRATATLSSGTVASVAVNNAGFNFTKAPLVRFLGGGQGPNNNTSYLGLGQPSAPAPSHPAQAHCVMTGSAGALSISSIVVDDPGAGYQCAPYVEIINSDLDPYGAAIPTLTSAGLLLPNGTLPVQFSNAFCPTGAISVIGTASDVLLCRYGA